MRDRHPRRLWFGIALAGVLAAAPLALGQSTAMPSLDNVISGMQRVLAGPTLEGAGTPPAEEVESPFHLPFTPPSGQQVEVIESEGLISLSVREATLRQVLAALAETQGFNLVIAAPADQQVTAEFKKMPLQEVFDSLLRSTGHSWTEHNNVIVVSSVANGGDLAPEVQGRRVAVIELDFASAADLQPAVEGLLSPVGQSYYVETNSTDNRRTKEMLIVEDLDPYLRRIEFYVSQADQAPRQVLIEVNLLQVTLDDSQRCGINFESLGRIAGTPLTLSTQGLAGALPGAAGASGAAGGLSGSSSLSGSAWNSGSPGFFIQSSGGDLDAVIEALITTTDAKSLANPRLLAVNGQESSIQVGQQIGYTTTTTVVNGTTSSGAEFLEVGTILKITPRITRDGRILLNIAPEVSTGAINPVTNAPDKDTTNLNTSVLLSSGQGMIIGGLIQESDVTNISRVPFLGSLPYINPLFQSRQVKKRRSELIVALTPYVTPLSPELECRNQEELMRAREPLVTGPLCRNPRPYEAKLFDPYSDVKRLHVFDRPDPFCPAPVEATVCEAPEAEWGPHYLHMIDESAQTEPSYLEPAFVEPEMVDYGLRQPEIGN
ncbi:type II secretion system protein GspD [Botrimarina colliarenosi]|uniref:type II secretion system protein GspD n=1 Tax=Botrimarina colliarenosi TaxID=2528001 RepID=UPI0011B756BD|nr:hypothetical protein [Botrimarina colliarenosi]